MGNNGKSSMAEALGQMQSANATNPGPQVRLSLDTIENIKRELAKLLPDVKSSHRIEAAARGFGYNTNAAMRTDIGANPGKRSINADTFRTYLSLKGFEVKGNELAGACMNARVLV